MKKKVLDISSPDEFEEEEESFPRRKPKKPKNRNSNLSWILGSIGAVLIIVAILWATSGFYSKLTLKITPQTNVEVFEDDVEVNISQDSVDLLHKIIPGRFFETDVSKNETFQATGREVVSSKARGTITIYNSQTPAQGITLREQTRFLSDSGKVFRVEETVFIPPAQESEGEVIPGEKQVEVAAQEAGEDYNIGPSEFSVPGLAGTSLYYTIWAKSETAMTGGSESEMTVVKEEDLENAKKSLEDALKEEAKTSLENQIPKEFSVNVDSMVVDNFDPTCSAGPEEPTPQFTCKATIKVKALGYRMQDLKSIAMESISKNLANSNDFDEGSLRMEVTPQSLLSETGKMVVSLTSRVNAYKDIETAVIPGRIAGEGKETIRESIFKSYPETEEIKFEFSPFWVTKAPSDPDRIHVEITP